MYAKSLLEMAGESSQLDAVADEVEQLRKLLADQPDLMRLLGSQVMSSEERATSVKSLFEGNVSDLLYRFILVVNDKGRLDRLPQILTSFDDQLGDARGIVQVDAYVAASLDSGSATKVAANIGQALGKKVVLNQHVDEDLIGGIKLRIGDRMVDGSVATQLRLLKNKLVETGRQLAKSGDMIEQA